jgi:UDP-2,3-diacylglucosamine pyrophosphatase LpxH
MEKEHESFQALEELYVDSPVLRMLPGQKYLIISDLHLGNGTASDDFRRNADLTLRVLDDYRARGYFLVLNGDIEELLRFELRDIMRRWRRFYEIIEGFRQGGGLLKIVGNHDIDLLDLPDNPWPVQEAVRLLYGDESIFVFHGHQMSRRLRRPNPVITFILRYIATPLRIKNYSVSADSARKFKLERTIFRFSARQRILSIIGHTHRPLFESMSKIDSLRFEIEQLCLAYNESGSERKKEIERRISFLKDELQRLLDKDDRLDQRSSLYDASLVVPCMFNSGTAIGKSGITCIEIQDGVIRLVHWFDLGRNSGYLQRSSQSLERLPDSECFKVVIKEDGLDNIFSRIRLLGG